MDGGDFLIHGCIVLAPLHKYFILFQPTWPFDRLGVPMCTSNKVFLSIRNNKIQGNSEPVWITIINFKAALFSNHELFCLQQKKSRRTIHWTLVSDPLPYLFKMLGLGTGSHSVDRSRILKVLETGKMVFSYLSCRSSKYRTFKVSWGIQKLSFIFNYNGLYCDL